MTTTQTEPRKINDEKRISVHDKMFLSQEFLTWLYFAALADHGVSIDANAMTKDGQEMNVVVGKKVALRDFDSSGVRVSLSGFGLSDSGEVLQAVWRGACVDTLSMEMSIGNRVYSFTLGVEGGVFNFKLPDLFTDPDEGQAGQVGEVGSDGKEVKRKRRPKLPLEDVIELRMQCCDELEDVIDALFAEFLRRRLDPETWVNDQQAISEAIANGLQARVPVLP